MRQPAASEAYIAARPTECCICSGPAGAAPACPTKGMPAQGIMLPHDIAIRAPAHSLHAGMGTTTAGSCVQPAPCHLAWPCQAQGQAALCVHPIQAHCYSMRSMLPAPLYMAPSSPPRSPPPPCQQDEHAGWARSASSAEGRGDWVCRDCCCLHSAGPAAALDDTTPTQQCFRLTCALPPVRPAIKALNCMPADIWPTSPATPSDVYIKKRKTTTTSVLAVG